MFGYRFRGGAIAKNAWNVDVGESNYELRC